MIHLLFEILFIPGGRSLKKILQSLLCFVLTAGLCMGCLLLSAGISKERIRDHMTASAQYLRDGELFGEAAEGYEGSRIDRYADAILLNIAWHYDAERPLSSVMESAYYFTIYHEENENLYLAVTGDEAATQQYLRYWHGSIALLRPLLVLLDLPEIYRFHAVLMAIGFGLLLFVLLRKKWYGPAAALAAGLIGTAVWYVPLSLEYTWLFLLLIPACLLAIAFGGRRKREAYPFLFLTTGILACFLDFLTVETMPCLVPLLLILWAEYRQTPDLPAKEAAKLSFRLGLTYAAGYAGMWALKWGLAALVLRENVLPYITSHVAERIGGDVGVGPVELLLGAITRNVACLFPAGCGIGGALAAVAIVLVCAYFGYVYRRKEVHKDRILLYLGIGLVPYLRYLVLHNHAYLHCFFTYRAQIATILALGLILGELVDAHFLQGKRKGGQRHGR